MKKNVPQPYSSRLWRAIIEFDMIAAGDRILVGLSGGKDSAFLTYALSCLRHVCPRPFELAAVNLDPGFTADFDTAPLADFCRSLDVPFHTIQADIAGAIAANDGKDPCYTCSVIRRGAINTFAADHGFNKVAYAHHHDDAVETFLMSILCSGQLTTFLPVTHLERSGITVIRPLIYFRENELISAQPCHGLQPLPSPCPHNGRTRRQDIKELLYSLQSLDKNVYSHLAAAMRQGHSVLWPAAPDRTVLRERHEAFWRK